MWKQKKKTKERGLEYNNVSNLFCYKIKQRSEEIRRKKEKEINSRVILHTSSYS